MGEWTRSNPYVGILRQLSGGERSRARWLWARIAPLIGTLALVGGCQLDWRVDGNVTDGAVDAADAAHPPDAGDASNPCGNDVIEGGEECDGTALGDESCVSQSYTTGVLRCGSDCHFDTSSCQGLVVCGDGVMGLGEECDDGDEDAGDGCDGHCDLEPGWVCVGEPSVCEGGCGNGLCHHAGGEDAASCAEDCAWVRIAVGQMHTCAVKAGGTVWCWGNNAAGQLGDGTLEDRNIPVRVATVEDATSVACGDGHSCALTASGAVWCWGTNAAGQLGDGTHTPATTAVLVSGLPPATHLTAGARHTCAVATNQQAWCWGSNAEGQLGDGSPASKAVPTLVLASTGLTAVKVVAAGGQHTCAIAADDTLWCWGDNEAGQLGDDTTHGRLSPVAVDVSGGCASAHTLSCGAAHSCAIDQSGTAWCWGSNDQKRLGTGTGASADSPVLVANVGAALDITAGAQHGCAVAANGTLWCWGSGIHGQIGCGQYPSSASPTVIAAPTNGAGVAAGERHTCATTADGAAWCWGGGEEGQLGSGTNDSQNVPVLVLQ